MKRILTLLGIILAFSLSLSAQGGYQVKGTVVDATGPVIGATVMEAGTSNGVSTDIDGNYVLIVSSANASVQFSCVGYVSQSFKASQVPARVTLAEDAQIDGVEVAEDSSGKTLGYVINVTDHNGYGGDVSFSLGIKNDGTLNGISFTTLNETAGLGQKAKEPKFSSQFTDKKVSGTLEVVKTTPSSDNQIEAISGATITSRAVTGGANAALAYFNAVLGGGSNE